MKTLIEAKNALAELVSRRERVTNPSKYEELTLRIREIEIEIMNLKSEEELLWRLRSEEKLGLDKN